MYNDEVQIKAQAGQQLAAPGGASRGRDFVGWKYKLHSSLPGRNMAADQHAQPVPGMRDDKRQAALGGRICAGD